MATLATVATFPPLSNRTRRLVVVEREEFQTCVLSKRVRRGGRVGEERGGSVGGEEKDESKKPAAVKGPGCRLVARKGRMRASKTLCSQGYWEGTEWKRVGECEGTFFPRLFLLFRFCFGSGLVFSCPFLSFLAFSLSLSISHSPLLATHYLFSLAYL